MLRRPVESVLAASIGMMGQTFTRLSDHQGFAQRLERQLLVQPITDRPANHPPGNRSNTTARYSQPSLVHTYERYCRRIQVIGAKAAKRVTRVVARGDPSSQRTIRAAFIAAVVQTS